MLPVMTDISFVKKSTPSVARYPGRHLPCTNRASKLVLPTLASPSMITLVEMSAAETWGCHKSRAPDEAEFTS